MNLLQGITQENMHGLAWLNEPKDWKPSGRGIRMRPHDYADFFIDPSGRHIRADAPLLYAETEGDFVAKALVKPTFESVWDSVVLMVRASESCWAKLCFEYCDAGDGYKGIVSVVTKGTSDDANGYPLDASTVWLQVCRVGNTFAMHWSADGKHWTMARLFGLDSSDRIQVGVAGQCPGGPSVWHEVRSFSLENRTVADIRKGE